jgi:hypothetical protein
MKNIRLTKNFTSNIAISIFTFSLPFIFIFFTIETGLLRSFSMITVNQMAAIDLVVDRQEGVVFDEDSHQLDYIEKLPSSESEQKILKERLDDIYYMFLIIPFIITIIIIFIKGWKNIKSKVKYLEWNDIKSQIPLLGMDKIKWYVSKHSFSYGFFTKRIILGTDYFFSSNEKRKFIINHELRHLTFKDSVLKNFLINLMKFFLPVFCVFFLGNYFFSQQNTDIIPLDYF